MKIGVIGVGYVGIANALTLATKYQIIAVDNNTERIASLRKGKSYFQESLIESYLKKYANNLTFSDDLDSILTVACDYIILAVPTNYDDVNQYFDVSILETVLKQLHDAEQQGTIIIKSTIPVGFIEQIQTKYPQLHVVFAPEFLQENTPLFDSLNPSRIIVGEKSKKGLAIAEMFKACVLKDDVEILLTGAKEAETIKLFSNTYLAMRVAFFNELDTFAEQQSLKTAEIITGIGLDERIGNQYNNPSFGYGGYCLPKDTKQLVQNFADTPQALIANIQTSNELRKEHIVRQILNKQAKTIGIYRLTMKSHSDNFRSAAIIDIIELLKKADVELMIYEPLLTEATYLGIPVTNKLDEFIEHAELIVANRVTAELQAVKNKIYSRDIFHTG